jgi:hypothetical protein
MFKWITCNRTAPCACVCVYIYIYIYIYIYKPNTINVTNDSQSRHSVLVIVENIRLGIYETGLLAIDINLNGTQNIDKLIPKLFET